MRVQWVKPAARACFLAWGPFDQPFWSSMLGVVHKYAGGPLTPLEQNPFKYAAPGSLSNALRTAEFQQIEEETRTLPWTWPGAPEEVWEQVQGCSTPFLPMIKRVPAEKWNQVNREVLQAVQKYVKHDGVRFGATVVLASGVK